MGLLKRLFGGAPALDLNRLAASTTLSEYAQLDLLAGFDPARPLDTPALRQRWSRVLPQSYDETIALLVKQGWLAQQGEDYGATPAAAAPIALWRQRLADERAAVMPKVRAALKARDTSEALDLRRAYEARQPLGEADWTGPEPQMSHSALTRRILLLNHWLLDGLSQPVADWLRFYAAEQHLWGAEWQPSENELPAGLGDELAAQGMAGMPPTEAAFWKARQLALQAENHETWLRCKGGDHVRRIKLIGPNDAFTCESCRAVLGKEYLVARTPELPHRECSSPRGCRCAYEPVLESFDEQQGRQ